MLNNWVFSVCITAVLGYLSGQGVGGGSLLMIWLTMIMGLEYSQAKTLNLLFFLPAALISSYYRRKTGVLSLKKVSPAIISGILAAAISAMLAPHLDTSILKKMFGALLIITGIRELYFRPRNAR